MPRSNTTQACSGSKTWRARTFRAAVDLLSRLIDALEAYLQVQPPSGAGPDSAPTRASAALESIATRILAEAPAAASPADVAPAVQEAESAGGP